jgi:tetratricopeptide (TPR) repeat protein
VEALGLLKAYSFVNAQVNDSILSLHRLVHLATRNWLRNRDALGSWIEKAADRLDKIFPNNSHDNRQMWREYLPHAQYLTDSTEFQAYQADHDDLLARIGSCLGSDGRYGEAEIVFRNALEIRERACGLEHPDTLTSISLLGLVLAGQGKYKEAEAMHRLALQGHEKALGPEHPDTLTSISLLGSVLDKQGKHEEAEAMHRQVLQGREKVLGPEHPETLTSISLLGSVLDKQGKYEEAEATHRRALQGYEKVLGPGHPDTLTSMHNLAFNLKQLGKVSNALSLLKKCADLRNKVLGSDHPHAISSFNILRDWEPAASQTPESQKQHALSDTLPALTLVHTLANDHFASASKPVGRKRRVFMNFFRRR